MRWGSLHAIPTLQLDTIPFEFGALLSFKSSISTASLQIRRFPLLSPLPSASASASASVTVSVAVSVSVSGSSSTSGSGSGSGSGSSSCSSY
jgi:hypothetical protein